MRSSYKIHNQESAYFITSTIIEWIPVFNSEKYFDILTGAIRFSQNEKGLKLYAYVFLDNHFHMIVSGNSLSNIIKSIKSFTAKEIIQQLKSDKKDWLLNQLKYYRLKHKINSEYQVWQESFHPQEILSDDILKQKMDYIHYNPVKRGYVAEPEYWKYSSADHFNSGKEGILKINGFDD